MRILIVEDEVKLVEQLKKILVKAGYVVDVASDGEEALYYGENEPYDLILLDIGLPVMNGLEVLRHWRQKGIATPVLILSARGTWSERVEGIDSGGDDYLPKPFHSEELLARISALIRRSAGFSHPEIICGDVRLDTRGGTVTFKESPVKLTAQEFRMLNYMLTHQGKVISRIEMIEHLYDQNFDKDSNIIEVFIGRLRKKIAPEYIVTERGLGYKFIDPSDALKSDALKNA